MQGSTTPLFETEKIIHMLLSKTLPATVTVFDLLLQQLEDYFHRPVQSIAEMKQRDDKTAKGRVWEQFCRDWLLATGRYQEVWMLRDVPAELRAYLRLGTADIGIDLIASSGFSNSIQFTAIQCKYRQDNKSRKVTKSLTWATLSTFYALCARTGPWLKHLVMTNCARLSSKMQRGPKDGSICLASFRSTKRHEWLKMVGLGETQQVGSAPSQPAVTGPTLVNGEEIFTMTVQPLNRVFVPLQLVDIDEIATAPVTQTYAINHIRAATQPARPQSQAEIARAKRLAYFNTGVKTDVARHPA
jgi:hypothetical protein